MTAPKPLGRKSNARKKREPRMPDAEVKRVLDEMGTRLAAEEAALKAQADAKLQPPIYLPDPPPTLWQRICAWFK